MDVVHSYSHLGGQEILLVRHPDLYREIEEVIGEVINPGRTKISKEKTMEGHALYSPKQLNKLFHGAFHQRGWTELRDQFTVEIPGYPHKIRHAFKQCDFHKGPVIVEVQFGKYAFMFYD